MINGVKLEVHSYFKKHIEPSPFDFSKPRHSTKRQAGFLIFIVPLCVFIVFGGTNKTQAVGVVNPEEAS
jgi:hypothetical protein